VSTARLVDASADASATASSRSNGSLRGAVDRLAEVGWAEERIELPPVSSSVARARRFCRSHLEEWGADDLDEVVSLLVSELVTNVVLHARTPCEVVMRRSDVLRIEVIDQDPRAPIRKDHDPEAASGRGLLLLAGMSSRHGADRDAKGKRVWFEVAWPNGWEGGAFLEHRRS
jgi:anti-sigma regulatory factor (Ser/Thr protein kinase)